MAYTYALNVIRQRTVNGRTAYSGVSRCFAVTRSTATDILEALGMKDDLEFINGDDEVCSVQVKSEKLLSASIDLAKQKINGVDVGSGFGLETELKGLIEVQSDLRASERATVFLELNCIGSSAGPSEGSLGEPFLFGLKPKPLSIADHLHEQMTAKVPERNVQ